MANNRREPTIKPATDAEMAKILVELVKTGQISAEVVNNRINSMRETTAELAKDASKVDETIEQEELLKNLEAQYATMKVYLERYKISTEDMPTWEQIREGLTPEVLGKALKLTEPTLLLIPPITRQKKIQLIDAHPVKGQTCETYTYKLNDNNLWNGGKSENERQCRVSIVEGVLDVALDPEICNGKKTNYEMAKEWVEKLESQGLNVVNELDTYLVLMMKGLSEGKPIDPQTYTVLNGENLKKNTLLARGLWSFGGVYLNYDSPTDSNTRLRLRGSVKIDIPQS